MKKVILSILLIVSISIFFNKIYGIAVSTQEAMSYVTATDNNEAAKKIYFYNTVIKDATINEFNKKGYIMLKKPWNKENTSSYYVKYIYKEILGGQEAYCLNPGLSVDKSYTAIESKLKKFSELDEYNRMIAVIYNADFSGIKVKYGSGDSQYLPNNEKTDYIIKQLVFWAYAGGKTGALNNDYTFNLNYSNGYTSTRSILTEDVCTAILHYYHGINRFGTYTDSIYIGYNNNNIIINAINSALSQSYAKLSHSSDYISITIYKPDRESTTNPSYAKYYQFFVGVYQHDETVKKVAVVEKRNGSYNTVQNYTNFTNSVTKAASDDSCTGYEVYTSPISYNSPISLVKNCVAYNSGESKSYTLNFDIAGAYNVIVFNYSKQEEPPEPKPAPTGDVTFYKQTGSGSYTSFDSISLEGYEVDADVNFSLTRGSISYYLVHNISGATAPGTNDNISSISFKMPENDISISVYYNYRIVDYSHLFTNGNKIDSPSGKSNPTKTTTFDAGIISVASWTHSDGFLYSTQHTVSGYYTKLKYMYGKKIENQTSSVSESSVHTNGTKFSNISNSASISVFKDPRSRKYYSYVNFYYDPVPSVKVVVRHLVRQANGSYAINDSLTNATAVLYNGQRAYSGVGIGSTIVENRYSQRKSVIKNSKSTLDSAEVSSYQNIYFGYSEFYEIDDKDQIIIDRSRVLMQNGKYYKCGGVRTARTGSADLSKINSLPFSSTSSLQQKISGKPGDYIYIDYYYDEVDLTTSVESSIGTTARLKFWPSAAGSYTSLGTNNSVVESNSGNENDNVAYVPASENLKPYVKSDLCRPYTMKYGLTLSGYTVEDYQVWGISNSSNMGKVNDIIGAENQVYSVDTYMSTDGSMVRSNISKTISDISSVSGVFTSNANSANNSFNSIFNKVSSYKTDQSYYINAAKYNIADNKYNGIRQPSGSVDYKIYSVYSGNASGGTRVTQNISTTNSMKVNIYTPATVDETKVGAIDFVNHSNIDNNTNGIIQQGVTFDVTVSTKKDAYPVNIYNQIGDTGKYVKYWYLMFDFDVTYGGRTYTANEPIKVNANRSNKYAETTITGLQAITNSEDKTVIESTLNHVKAIAATINLENDDYAINHLKQTTATKADTNSSDVRIANNYIPFGTTGDLGLSKASYYLVSKVTETISIGRVFDFEITDCLDVNFKDVFRVLNSEDKSVNSLTGTRYFSGIRRLLSTDSITNNSTNILADRAKLVVGSVTKILPLGPYKHTTNAYINSVKLGYRFSFDLKTSGYYNPGKNEDVKRSVKITPSYYYISKDGKTYNDNIKLYYKNSSGNYVDFETSNYTIYYKPDDGYRNLYNSSTYTETDVSKTSSNGTTTLTSSLVALKLGSKNGFTLNSNKSMTISDKGYLQAWYGEFKLPNSTIALAVDKNGRIDINSPMTDGYIGVKFKIECIDSYKNRTEDVIISYDKNDTCLGKNAVNTSQWDYEGYLGFKESNIGSNLNGTLKIQLENGVWNIDDAMYNNVKGTVILYDLDNRAANDYD